MTEQTITGVTRDARLPGDRRERVTQAVDVERDPPVRGVAFDKADLGKEVVAALFTGGLPGVANEQEVIGAWTPTHMAFAFGALPQPDVDAVA